MARTGSFSGSVSAPFGGRVSLDTLYSTNSSGGGVTMTPGPPAPSPPPPSGVPTVTPPPVTLPPTPYSGGTSFAEQAYQLLSTTFGTPQEQWDTLQSAVSYLAQPSTVQAVSSFLQPLTTFIQPIETALQPLLKPIETALSSWQPTTTSTTQSWTNLFSSPTSTTTSGWWY